MKRIFFIVGIIIIVILTAVLLFLLFASKDQKAAIFNKFNIGNTTTGTSTLSTIVNTLTGDSEGDKNVAALRQLTMRQVIGESEVSQNASSSNPVVYFGEAGTGHIYSVDTVTGTENRISNITIQTANKVAIDTTGTYAVVASGAGREGDTLTLLTLPRDGVELSSFAINETVKNFTLTQDGYVLYTTITADNLAARSFNIAKKEVKTLFTVPFTEATVRFGAKSTDQVFIYPKTAAQLEGYLYTMKSGKLQRLPIAGYGLNAVSGGSNILYSVQSDENFRTGLFNTGTRSGTDLPFTVVTDKCAFTANGTLVLCGTNGAAEAASAEQWYKGISKTNDDLWLIHVPTDVAPSAETLVSPKTVTGRDFDITTLTTSEDTSRVYFINNNDKSLWIFDRSKAQTQ